MRCDGRHAGTRAQLGLGNREFWLRHVYRLVGSGGHLPNQSLDPMHALVDIALVALCLLTAVLYLGRIYFKDWFKKKQTHSACSCQNKSCAAKKSEPLKELKK